MAGTLRFAIEFLRVNTRVLGPLTVAHLASAGVALVGVALLARPQVSERREPRQAARWKRQYWND